jgi:DNA-binding protein HU-beta
VQQATHSALREVTGVTKADLIDDVTQATGLKKKDVTNVVEAVFSTMTGQLKRHEKVQIVGFGTFEPRRRKARVGRDPRNQKTIRIPASWSLGFRPGKQLKEMVSGKAGKRRGR